MLFCTHFSRFLYDSMMHDMSAHHDPILRQLFMRCPPTRTLFGVELLYYHGLLEASRSAR